MKSFAFKQLVIGLIGLFILGEILLIAVFPFNTAYILGYMLGIAIAILLVVHMAYAIDRSLEKDEIGALKHIRITYAIRMVVLAISLLIIGLVSKDGILAALVGIFMLKISAYMQPLIYKFMSK